MWSGPRTPLLLGAAACAACCALPLAAVVVGAGAATTAALILEPLGAVLVASGVLMAVVGYARRRRRAAASCEATRACAIDQSCGCGPTMQDRAAAVGCTLPPEDMSGRGDEFRRLFERGLVRREVTGTLAVWTFTWTPELERDARALAAMEQECCSFWRFNLRRRGDELRWEATVPDERVEAITMLDSIAASAMTSSSRA